MSDVVDTLDTETQARIEERNLLLKDVDHGVIRKAWFTLAHLLLDEGAKVVDMGCGDGEMSYAMAALNPKIKITGMDKSKRHINKAKEKYQLHNLDFKVGDVSGEIFEPGSVDCIINSYVLHEVYSGSRYNEEIVSDTLKKHFRMLKKGGLMFIRDYSRPPPGEYVLLEIRDTPSGKDGDLASLSDADLLVWYAEHARPRQDPGCGGFFLEELPAKFPKTRLFRLPYKWAYEFIMRKDDRAHWQTELPMEYTFFTIREFRRVLRNLGARAEYSAPIWEEEMIAKKFEGHFRLYGDDGNPLGHPPTCFIAVARKMAERKSLRIEERRPSATEDGNLKISAMRNEKTGQIVDIVSRGLDVREILPYKVTEDGRLKIFLHDGVARGISNAVPRSGINLDGKRWSGHMVEPISVDGGAMSEIGEPDVKNTVRFARDHLGLKPRNNAVIVHGPDYYPAPDYIDERISTYYLEVESPKGPVTPKSFIGYSARFQARGQIREFDAQHVLNAISVGMIPSARLELQILSLFEHLGLKAETWTDKQFNVKAGEISANMDVRDYLKNMSNTDNRFREVKGTAGQLRTIHSAFVEEGQTQGAVTGLSSQDIDFVVSDQSTVNTAVVLPLTKSMKDDLYAGFTIEHLPVPQRHQGNGMTLSAPSFNLPKEITNMEMAKKYIADKFGVLPDMVLKLGESYYSHVGLTPQKIHPFAVAAPPSMFKDPNTLFLPIWQFRFLWASLSRQPHIMLTIARSWKFLHAYLKKEARTQVDKIVAERMANKEPDWSVPVSYIRAPILKDPEPGPEPEMPQPEEKPEAKDEPKAEEKSEVKEEPKEQPKPKVETDTTLMKDFEHEIEAFIEELEKIEEPGPRPEKW